MEFILLFIIDFYDFSLHELNNFLNLIESRERVREYERVQRLRRREQTGCLYGEISRGMASCTIQEQISQDTYGLERGEIRDPEGGVSFF